MSDKRVISSRVTGRRVLGSANPVARWGRGAKQTCFDSIGGFFVGLLLFFVPFGLTYCAAKTEKDSKDISQLTVKPAAEASAVDGKALLEGRVTAVEDLQPVIGEDLDGPVIYYDYHVRREVTKGSPLFPRIKP